MEALLNETVAIKREFLTRNLQNYADALSNMCQQIFSRHAQDIIDRRPWGEYEFHRNLNQQIVNRGLRWIWELVHMVTHGENNALYAQLVRNVINERFMPNISFSKIVCKFFFKIKLFF